jgi:hypothetical protein
VSGKIEGDELDVAAVTDGQAAAEKSGIAHARELVALAEGVVSGDETVLASSRRQIVEALGEQAMVDIAAVAGNFQRMVRIADGCGIPLDTPLQIMSADVRAELRLERFGTSANTPPPGLVGRSLGPLFRRIAPIAAKFVSKRMGARP